MIILPRGINLKDEQHLKTLTYLDVLKDKKPVGKRVTIIGTGGIGFDVAKRSKKLVFGSFFCACWGD